MASYFVSFDPGIPMEENVSPLAAVDDPQVRGLIEGALGVLVPVYLPPWRYRPIRKVSRDCFPRLEARHGYAGKSSQIRLFRRLGLPHPETLLFKNTVHLAAVFEQWGSPWGFPLVLKGDTGGGGSAVFPVHTRSDLQRCLLMIPRGEPVLLQRWVEHGGRDLRVVTYGDRAVSYFRVGDGRFYNNLCRGARLDRHLAPRDQECGVAAVRRLCRQVGIDMAGFDLMFPSPGVPLFIEINFHFGRKGLGGAVGHRRHWRRAVEEWRSNCLKRKGTG